MMMINVNHLMRDNERVEVVVGGEVADHVVPASRRYLGGPVFLISKKIK